jgi:hypothetical protein
MALLTDGGVSSIEDLRGYDSQLLDVASVEGIDVTRKLELAQEEITAEAVTLLGRLRRPGWLNAPPDPGRVVVTPPLKLWHTYLTLEMVYRDAYRSQLNDRYAGKRDEFHERAKWAYDALVETGLGIANDPVRRAAPPKVQPASGGLPDGTYYVAASWTNASGSEGAVSAPVMLEITGSTFLVTGAPCDPNVKGWNVYAGRSPEGITRQNETPLQPDQSWTQPGALADSAPAGTGQAADYELPVPRLLMRG